MSEYHVRTEGSNNKALANPGATTVTPRKVNRGLWALITCLGILALVALGLVVASLMFRKRPPPDTTNDPIPINSGYEKITRSTNFFSGNIAGTPSSSGCKITYRLISHVNHETAKQDLSLHIHVEGQLPPSTGPAPNRADDFILSIDGEKRTLSHPSTFDTRHPHTEVYLDMDVVRKIARSAQCEWRIGTIDAVIPQRLKDIMLLVANQMDEALAKGEPAH